MTTAKGKQMGRPTLVPGELGKRFQLHLPPSVAAHLRSIGNGSLSRGIIIVGSQDSNAEILRLRADLAELREVLEAMMDSAIARASILDVDTTKQPQMVKARKVLAKLSQRKRA